MLKCVNMHLCMVLALEKKKTGQEAEDGVNNQNTNVMRPGHLCAPVLKILVLQSWYKRSEKGN